MQQSEKTAKNVKATVATIVIHGILLLAFLVFGFKVPVAPPPPDDGGMEVNLGNSDQGFGTEQPLAPGDAAPEQTAKSSPATSQAPPAAEQPVTPDNTPDNENDVDVPAKPNKVVAKAPPVNREAATKKNTAKPVANPTPAPPRPKALMSRPGGTGPGGNNQDQYNNSRNQGIAGGQGDQGKPEGDPNSNNYNGNGGNGTGGVNITRGFKNRYPISIPAFKDDFNENATIYVDIKVDENGNVISATYQPKGSTTTNQNSINIALRNVKKIKFPKSSAFEEVGTLKVNLRVSN